MEGFRARDADRERHVGLIEAAYVDGQLGDADRELRVGRALSAETLDELQTLTRDLQLPAGYVAPVDQPSARPRRRASVLVALGVAVALIGFVVVATVLFLAPSGQVADSSGGVVESSQASPQPTEQPVDAPEVQPFEVTAPQVRAFLRRYEEKFGTTDAYDLVVFPDRVSVDVPVRGSRPRFETWRWDGAWTRTTEARAVNPSLPGVVDLGGIGPKRLIANIRVARRSLDVQRADFSHASLWQFDPVGPTIIIHVRNSFEEGAHLRTTLSGDRILARYPYGS